MKLSVVEDAAALPGDTFVIPKAGSGIDIRITAETRFKVSMWIYIPAGVVLRDSPYPEYDSSQLALTITAGSNVSAPKTIEFVTRASVNIRDKWQYMETILTPSSDWGGSSFSAYIGLGYPHTVESNIRSQIWEQLTYVYLDDLAFDKIPL